MSELSKTQKSAAVKWVFEVLQGLWMKRGVLKPSEFGDRQYHVELVSPNHAYCVSCQHHIYLSTVAEDVNSQFSKHLNSIQHIIRKKRYSNDVLFEKMTGDKWKCLVCKEEVAPVVIAKTDFTLFDKIEHHLQNQRHIAFNSIYTDRDLWILMGISKTPPFQALFTGMGCKICARKLNTAHAHFEHLCSKNHLKVFEEYLKDKYELKGKSTAELRLFFCKVAQTGHWHLTKLETKPVADEPEYESESEDDDLSQDCVEQAEDPFDVCKLPTLSVKPIQSSAQVEDSLALKPDYLNEEVKQLETGDPEELVEKNSGEETADLESDVKAVQKHSSQTFKHEDSNGNWSELTSVCGEGRNFALSMKTPGGASWLNTMMKANSEATANGDPPPLLHALKEFVAKVKANSGGEKLTPEELKALPSHLTGKSVKKVYFRLENPDAVRNGFSADAHLAAKVEENFDREERATEQFKGQKLASKTSEDGEKLPALAIADSNYNTNVNGSLTDEFSADAKLSLGELQRPGRTNGKGITSSMSFEPAKELAPAAQNSAAVASKTDGPAMLLSGSATPNTAADGTVTIPCVSESVADSASALPCISETPTAESAVLGIPTSVTRGILAKPLKMMKAVTPPEYENLRQPHPAEMVARQPMSFKRDNTFMDLINPFHAYCYACSEHIYSYSDRFDVCSFFEKHVNDPDHQKQFLAPSVEMFQLDKAKTLGEDTWRCNGCRVYLLPEAKTETYTLRNFVEKHFHSVVHIRNCRKAMTNDRPQENAVVALESIRKLSTDKKTEEAPVEGQVSKAKGPVVEPAAAPVERQLYKAKGPTVETAEAPVERQLYKAKGPCVKAAEGSAASTNGMLESALAEYKLVPLEKRFTPKTERIRYKNLSLREIAECRKFILMLYDKQRPLRKYLIPPKLSGMHLVSVEDSSPWLEIPPFVLMFCLSCYVMVPNCDRVCHVKSIEHKDAFAALKTWKEHILTHLDGTAYFKALQPKPSNCFLCGTTGHTTPKHLKHMERHISHDLNTFIYNLDDFDEQQNLWKRMFKIPI